MPPIFKMRLQVNQDLLERLRALPERAQRNIKRKIRIELGPVLEEDANDLMEEGPGQVSSPFQFGTDKSRKFYLALVNEYPELTDGEHWLRTGEIERSFVVEVSDRFRENLIRIVNKHGKGRFVLGPWTVQGHINTGWPDFADEVRQVLRAKARREIARMWRDSIREAIKGQG